MQCCTCALCHKDCARTGKCIAHRACCAVCSGNRNLLPASVQCSEWAPIQIYNISGMETRSKKRAAGLESAERGPAKPTKRARSKGPAAERTTRTTRSGAQSRSADEQGSAAAACLGTDRRAARAGARQRATQQERQAPADAAPLPAAAIKGEDAGMPGADQADAQAPPVRCVLAQTCGNTFKTQLSGTVSRSCALSWPSMRHSGASISVYAAAALPARAGACKAACCVRALSTFCWSPMVLPL